MKEEDVFCEIMETYTETTKVTTIFVDCTSVIKPMFSKGLDIPTLIDYTDFEEVLDYLNTELIHNSKITNNQNTIHTYFTKSFFVYNIILVKSKNDSYSIVVAGPMLIFLPSEKFLHELMIDKKLPIYKKKVFSRLLYNLPLVTNERIYQQGKLLLHLFIQFDQSDKKCITSVVQVFHGRKKPEDKNYSLNTKVQIDKVDEYNTKVQAYYKLIANLVHKILEGNINGLVDTIGEFAYLFRDKESTNTDNCRNLKNKCIIIFTICCYIAIQANVPYGQMSFNIWNSILKLEKMNSVEEIIVHMAKTIRGFAEAVKALSVNHYSLHINRVLHYIKSHYTQEITLKELSKHINVNPVYLSSLIKKETNMSLSNHINQLRIEESKKLLMYTNKSVQEIAYDVGYNYQNHFSSIFKKIVGQTPLEFRKNKGSINHIS